MKTTMQGSLLAAACLFSGGALAESSVTVQGLLDLAVGSVKFSGDHGSSAGLTPGGMTTSWLGFKGTEELGGGLKAEFALTSFLRPDTGEAGRFFGDNLFSRDANLALSGAFGRVSLGRDIAPSFLPVILFNPYGDSFAFSPLVLHWYVPSGAFAARSWANAAAGDSGWSNQIIYSTPNFDGLSANLHYQFGEKAGDSGNRNIGLNTLYFHGPLALSAFYHKVQASNPNGGAALVDATAAPVNYGSINEQRAYFVGASYDFGVVKAYATYSSSRDDGAAGKTLDDKLVSLGLSVPAGGGAILAAYANTKRSGSLAGSDLQRDTLSLGYDYNLSKRTDLYSVLMSDKLNTAERATSLAAGIRHKF